MGLFDKFKKERINRMNWDEFCEFVMMKCILTNGQLVNMNLNIDEMHMYCVDIAYEFGLSIICYRQLIGNNIDSFVNRFKMTLNTSKSVPAQLITYIPIIENYINKAVSVVKNMININSEIYTRQYLTDLYQSESYPVEMFTIAKQDIENRYTNWGKIPKVEII